MVCDMCGLLRSRRCEGHGFGACQFSALRAEFPFQRNIGRTRDFFVRVQIGTACRFHVCSAAISISGRLCSCASLDSIFLYSDEVFSILDRVLRRDYLSTERIQRILCGFGSDLFFQLFFGGLCQCVFCFCQDDVVFVSGNYYFVGFNFVISSLRRFDRFQDFE